MQNDITIIWISNGKTIYIHAEKDVCYYLGDNLNLMNLIKLHSRRLLVPNRKLLQYILLPLAVLYINI